MTTEPRSDAERADDTHAVWLHAIEKYACSLTTIEGFEDSYLFRDGVPLADRWPSDVVMTMDPDLPEDLQLTDSLFNTLSMLVVSERLADALRERVVAPLELLPVGIRDHKGKIVEAPYHVVNLTRHHDCLDAGASGAVASLVPGEYRRVERLVLSNREAIGDENLFRLQGFGVPTIVTRELAAALDADGFSGFRWGALDAFTDNIW